MVECMYVVVNVMLSLMSVMSPPCLLQPMGTHGGEFIYFGCVIGELGFPNCDDICMCVVYKQFELFVCFLNSVYVDLQHDEIYLTITAGYVSL